MHDYVNRRPVYRPGLWPLIIGAVILAGCALLIRAGLERFWPF